MNIFADYDEQIDPPTLLEQRTRDMMILGSAWLKKDGDFAGHFKDRAPHACIWSCQWDTANGIIAPKNFYSLDRMTSKEVIAEASDMLGQFSGDIAMVELTPLMTDYFLETIKDPNWWIGKVQKIIRTSRVLYKGFLCPWSMPENVYAWNYRPGWPQPPKPAQDRTPKTKFGNRAEPPLTEFDPHAHRRAR